VINNGPAKAKNVVVTVKLDGAPLGPVARFEPDRNWKQRNPARALVAELGSMDKNQAAHLRFLMSPRGTGMLSARAGVTSNVADLDPSNSEAIQSIEISEQMLQAHLGVFVQNPVSGSAGASFEITVHNSGPATVVGAEVMLRVASGGSESVGFRVPSLSPEWGDAPAGVQTSARFSATLNLLEAGASRVLVVVLMRESGGKTLTLEAKVHPPQGFNDPDPTNNSAIMTFEFEPI
jgi:hypothetical protein